MPLHQRLQSEFPTETRELIIERIQKLLAAEKTKAASILDLEQAFKTLWAQSYAVKEEGVMSVHEKEIHYQITPLGDFPCIQLMINGENYSTKHSLISLAYIDKPNYSLEVRAVKPIVLKECAAKLVKLVKGEVLTWSMHSAML